MSNTGGDALEETGERVLGDIAVTVKLPMGFERLTLYFTDRRIIVGHLSKVSGSSVAPTFLLGSIGGALSGLFGRKKGSKKGKSGGYPSPIRVLDSHRDNFSISFGEVVSVDLTHGPEKNSIAILSSNDKFDFTTRSRFEHVRSLFQGSLGDKVKVH